MAPKQTSIPVWHRNVHIDEEEYVTESDDEEYEYEYA